MNWKTDDDVKDVNDFEFAIRPAMKQHGFTLLDLRDYYNGNVTVREQIMQGIEESTVVLAQITNSSLSTMFEIGYAMALKKEIILLRRENEDEKKVPIVLEGLERVEYASHVDLAMQIYFRLHSLSERLHTPTY